MSVEAINKQPEGSEPIVELSEFDGVGNFEKLLIQGLSTDCKPCYTERVGYVRTYALIFSARTESVPAAIQRLEEDILPCQHVYDNDDVVLAVQKRLGLNRANG